MYVKKKTFPFIQMRIKRFLKGTVNTTIKLAKHSYSDVYFLSIFSVVLYVIVSNRTELWNIQIHYNVVGYVALNYSSTSIPKYFEGLHR